MSSDVVIFQSHMGLRLPADETACPAAAGLHVGNVCACLLPSNDCERVPLQAGHCPSSDEQLLQSMLILMWTSLSWGILPGLAYCMAGVSS